MHDPAVPHGNTEQNTLLLDIATRDVASFGLDGSARDAAQVMSQRRISSVVVTDGAGHPAGIVTERDILRAVQSGRPREALLRDIMSSPVISVSPAITMLDAYRLCLQRSIRHLVIVDGDGKLAGVASETDFRQHLNLSTLAGRRKIAAVAGHSTLILPPEASLSQALGMMLEQRASCVVVVEGRKPVGIVTERDVVRFYSGARTSGDTALAEAMTSPVLAISGDASCGEAAEMMLARKVRHLVVVDDSGCMTGLASEHDLTQAMMDSMTEERDGIEENLLRTLINTLPDLVWLKDEEGVYLACNARFEKFFGAKERDIVGKSDYDFMGRELAESFRGHDRKAVEKGGPSVNEEWVTFAGDGHRELLETVKTPMRSRSGKLIGVLGIARDITVRKRLEENLERSERKLHNIYDSVGDCIEIISPDGRILDMNRIGYERLGYTREEMIGRKLSEFAAPGHAEQVAERSELIRQKGYATFESARLRKDGTVMPLEVRSRCIEFDGQEVFLGISRDISERKRTENALRFIAQRGGSEQAESILGGIAQYLGRELAVDYVIVDRLADEEGAAETVALYAKGGIVPNIRYALKDTPCDNVVHCGLCYYGKEVQKRFPKDALLVDMGVESYAGIPLWDASGQVIGLLAVMDGKPFGDEAAVTGLLQLMASRAAAELERMRSEQLLRMREREFRTLAENAPENIVRYDRDCRTAYVNPRMLRTLGFTADRMLGKTPTEIFPDGASRNYESALRRVMELGGEEYMEVTLPAADGSLLYHSIYFVPECNDAGEVTGALAMGSDITERKRAELALRQSLEFAEGVINAIPDLLIEFDRDGRYINIWAHDPALLAAQKEMLLGHTVREMLPAAAAATVMSAIEEAAGKGSSGGQVICLDLPQGRNWFELSTAAKPAEDALPQHFIMLSRDITGRMRAEAELHANEEKLRGLYELSPMGIALTDMQGHYLEFNEAFRNICGYTRDELNKLDYWALTPKEYADREAEQLESLNTRGYYGPYEKEYIRKDGSRIPLRLNGVLVRDHEGKPYIWSIVEDITGRKAAEQKLLQNEAQLREQKEFLDAVFENALDAVVLMDERGICTRWNRQAEEIFGWKAGEAAGRFMHELIIPERQREAHVRGMKRFLESGEGPVLNKRIEITALRRDGSEFPIELSISPIKTANGYEFSSFIRDISGRKRAELQRAHDLSLLNATLESSADAILVVGLDGKWSLYNQRFLELWRIPADIAALGDDKAALSYIIERLEDPGVFLDKVLELYATPEASSFDAFRFKDGSIIERYSIPQRITGEVVGRVWSFRDVTERRRAENALREREEVFSSIVNQAADSIVLIDSETLKVAEFNPVAHESLGYTREEFAALTVADIQAELSPEQIRQRIKRSMDRNETLLFETRHRRKDGSIRETQVSSRPVTIRGRRYVSAIWSDITGRKRDEETLRVTASVFETTQEAILITDADNLITDVNPAFTRITGYSREEVQGRNPKLLASGHHDKAFYAAMWKSLAEKKSWRGEIWNQRKNGETYAELLSISVVCNAAGKVLRHVGVFSDISHIKEHEAELSRVAHYDTLTGIPNRVLLADRMRQAIAQTAREQDMMAVCYLDLDGFKPINDKLGHEAGDMVLIEIARRIAGTIRGGDTVARLGGDEFVVLLLGLERGDECVTTLERLLAAISQPLLIGEEQHVLSASIGVSIYPLDDEDPDTLLRHADQAMYVAKQSGKNRFYIYDPALDQRVRSQHEFLSDIRHGMEQGEFDLYYQPKINLRTKQLVGVEALVRWRHPERGLLGPMEFLRQVENTELDIEVGEWVIAAALAQIDRWHRAGLDIEVSINISAYHLESRSFAEKLRQHLAQYPALPPGMLQIEVLETAALNDLAIVREVIEACGKFGVTFALDDFGTGYSSLSYLSSLPVDVLKIDQSFVRDMLEDAGDMAIVQGIIALAHAFGRHTVAEGVETAAHYRALLDAGCEIGQGYGIARPMPAEELAGWKTE